MLSTQTDLAVQINVWQTKAVNRKIHDIINRDLVKCM